MSEMKQSDKCKCIYCIEGLGRECKLHSQTNKCKCNNLILNKQGYFICKICQRLIPNSLSISRIKKSQHNVCKECYYKNKGKSHSEHKSIRSLRALEEEFKREGTPCSASSSVPYTPLTMNKMKTRYLDKSKKYVICWDNSDVLSALNGLREDIYIKSWTSNKEIDKIFNKWFPIINEVKKE